MPCTPINLGNGVTGIVCTRGSRDRKLCVRHAHRIGAARDLCPDHANAPAPPAETTSHVFTGSVHRHRGDPDALDITAMTGGPAGRPFAPSMILLKPALAARRKAEKILLGRDALLMEGARTMDEDDPRWAELHLEAGRIAAEAAAVEDGAWTIYRRGFWAEMLISSGREVPPAWARDAAEARARGVVPHVDVWAAELLRPRRVYLCYCPTRERCHRGLVVEIRVRMGAVDGGELPSMRPVAAPDQLGLFGGRPVSSDCYP